MRLVIICHVATDSLTHKTQYPYFSARPLKLDAVRADRAEAREGRAARAAPQPVASAGTELRDQHNWARRLVTRSCERLPSAHCSSLKHCKGLQPF